MIKDDQQFDIFDQDCSENHEKYKNFEKITNNQTLDMFDQDCNEDLKTYQNL